MLRTAFLLLAVVRNLFGVRRNVWLGVSPGSYLQWKRTVVLVDPCDVSRPDLWDPHDRWALLVPQTLATIVGTQCGWPSRLGQSKGRNNIRWVRVAWVTLFAVSLRLNYLFALLFLDNMDCVNVGTDLSLVKQCNWWIPACIGSTTIILQELL